jgi:hypothetical protein
MFCTITPFLHGLFFFLNRRAAISKEIAKLKEETKHKMRLVDLHLIFFVNVSLLYLFQSLECCLLIFISIVTVLKLCLLVLEVLGSQH